MRLDSHAAKMKKILLNPYAVFLLLLSLVLYFSFFRNKSADTPTPRFTVQFLVDDLTTEYQDGMCYFIALIDKNGEVHLPYRHQRIAQKGPWENTVISEGVNTTVMRICKPNGRVLTDMNFTKFECPFLFAFFNEKRPVDKVLIAHKSPADGILSCSNSKPWNFTEYTVQDTGEPQTHLIQVYSSYLEKNKVILPAATHDRIMALLSIRNDEEEKERNRVRP